MGLLQTNPVAAGFSPDRYTHLFTNGFGFIGYYEHITGFITPLQGSGRWGASYPGLHFPRSRSESLAWAMVM